MSTARSDLLYLYTKYIADGRFHGSEPWMEKKFLEHWTSLTQLALLAAIIFSFTYVLLHFPTYNDGLPVVNRRFPLEPRIFARIRWATKARDILEIADQKVWCIRALKMKPS